jgi:hypothetical protein
MEECDCSIRGKVLFQGIVGVKIWAEGEAMQMGIEGTKELG